MSNVTHTIKRESFKTFMSAVLGISQDRLDGSRFSPSDTFHVPKDKGYNVGDVITFEHEEHGTSSGTPIKTTRSYDVKEYDSLTYVCVLNVSSIAVETNLSDTVKVRGIHEG